MKSTPLISIIIPVYNCERKIEFHKLLHSIKLQSYTNFEVLLCDDGSVDKTKDVCKAAVSEDCRFKYIECEHSGVSKTRNKGIQESKGEWITFVDSDDLLAPSFLYGLIKPVCENVNPDYVLGSFLIVSSTTEAFIYNDKLYNGKEEIKEAFTNTRVLERCSPWAKLFKTSIIKENKLQFNPNLSHSEDREFIYSYLLHINSFATSSIIGYIYGSYSATSLKHKKLDINKIYLRQTLLTEGALNVLNAFSIELKSCKYIFKNLIHLLKEGIWGIYFNEPNESKRLSDFKEFTNRFLTPDIKRAIEENQEMRTFIQEDNLSWFIFNEKFSSINRYLIKMDKRLSLYSLFRKFLRAKHLQLSFSTSIYNLN